MPALAPCRVTVTPSRQSRAAEPPRQAARERYGTGQAPMLSVNASLGVVRLVKVQPYRVGVQAWHTHPAVCGAHRPHCGWNWKLSRGPPPCIHARLWYEAPPPTTRGEGERPPPAHLCVQADAEGRWSRPPPALPAPRSCCPVRRACGVTTRWRQVSRRQGGRASQGAFRAQRRLLVALNPLACTPSAPPPQARFRSIHHLTATAAIVNTASLPQREAKPHQEGKRPQHTNSCGTYPHRCVPGPLQLPLHHRRRVDLGPLRSSNR